MRKAALAATAALTLFGVVAPADAARNHWSDLGGKLAWLTEIHAAIDRDNQAVKQSGPGAIIMVQDRTADGENQDEAASNTERPVNATLAQAPSAFKSLTRKAADTVIATITAVVAVSNAGIAQANAAARKAADAANAAATAANAAATAAATAAADVAAKTGNASIAAANAAARKAADAANAAATAATAAATAAADVAAKTGNAGNATAVAAIKAANAAASNAADAANAAAIAAIAIANATGSAAAISSAKTAAAAAEAANAALIALAKAGAAAGPHVLKCTGNIGKGIAISLLIGTDKGTVSGQLLHVQVIRGLQESAQQWLKDAQTSSDPSVYVCTVAGIVGTEIVVRLSPIRPPTL